MLLAKNKWNAFLLLVLLILSSPLNSQNYVDPQDSLALVALYKATNGPGWFDNTNWLVTNVEFWEGVTTEQNRVVYIILPNHNLTGYLPVELGNLTKLISLRFSKNKLTGNIIHQIGNLINLRYLELNNNLFTGNIPAELSKLTSLLYLDIDNNQVSGIIPTELGNLTELENLYLSNNQLTGTVPDEIYNLFESFNCNLYLGGNKFYYPEISDKDSIILIKFYQTTNGDTWDNKSGWFKEKVGNWHGILVKKDRVIGIDLNGNSCSGIIPFELAELTNLHSLVLDHNQLTGAIPSELGNLSKLKKLNLGMNELTGTIPPELGNLDNLQVLDLDVNRLSGSIPSELGNLNNLMILILYNNDFNGIIPFELSKLRNIEEIDLSFNELTGEVPQELGNLNNLKYLFFHNNNLTGRIPSELGNLTNLIYLNLYNNNLSGTIPSELGNLTNLIYLNLSYNLLTGSLPSELGNLYNLEELELSLNNLTGTIPSEFEKLSNIQVIDLSFNQLTGIIPIELVNIYSTLDVSDNYLIHDLMILVDFKSNDSICLNNAVKFFNYSTVIDNPGFVMDSIIWNFGDGIITNTDDPIHIFSKQGIYNVKIACFYKTVVYEKTKTIIVKDKPAADFIANPVCLGEPTIFINNTNKGTLDIDQWYWDLKDGTTSFAFNPGKHIYKNDTVYDVFLKAIATNGCADSITKNVIVKSGPPQPKLITHGPNYWYFVCDNAKASEYIWYYNGLEVNNNYSKPFIYKAGSNLGTYQVKIKNKDDECYAFSDVITIPDMFGSSTTKNNEILVYPNPNNGRISLSINNDYKGPIQLRLLDVSGNVIDTKRVNKEYSQKEIEYQIWNKNHQSPFYMLEILYDKAVEYRKIVIKE